MQNLNNQNKYNLYCCFTCNVIFGQSIRFRPGQAAASHLGVCLVCRQDRVDGVLPALGLGKAELLTPAGDLTPSTDVDLLGAVRVQRHRDSLQSLVAALWAEF